MSSYDRIQAAALEALNENAIEIRKAIQSAAASLHTAAAAQENLARNFVASMENSARFRPGIRLTAKAVLYVLALACALKYLLS